MHLFPAQGRYLGRADWHKQIVRYPNDVMTTGFGDCMQIGIGLEALSLWTRSGGLQGGSVWDS